MEVAVPVVIGLSPDAAEEVLEEAGFVVNYANGRKPGPEAGPLLVDAQFVNMQYVVDETMVANKGTDVTLALVPAGEYENPIGDKNPNQ